MKKVILTILLTLLGIVGINYSVQAADVTITFEDQSIYKGVIVNLEEQKIAISSKEDSTKTIVMTEENVAKVTDLNLGAIFIESTNKDVEGGDSAEVKVKNLKGLEKFTNIKDLYLWDTLVQDSSTIENLTKLQTLAYTPYVNNTNISFLSKLPNLTTLELNRKYVNFDVVNQCTKLETLVLNNTNLEALNEIGKLTNLKRLEVRWAEISDISNITMFKKLEKIIFGNTYIEDISAVYKLPNLKEKAFHEQYINEIVLIEGKIATLPEIFSHYKEMNSEDAEKPKLELNNCKLISDDGEVVVEVIDVNKPAEVCAIGGIIDATPVKINAPKTENNNQNNNQNNNDKGNTNTSNTNKLTTPKKDNTTAITKLPKAGSADGIGLGIVLLAIVAILGIRYYKIRKITK